MLTLFVGMGVIALGVSTAWLVTHRDFTGRRVLEWCLLLPLAMPSYLLAYIYTDLFQVTGAIPLWLHYNDKSWLAGLIPPIRTIYGASAVFILALYPYVYILTRATFLESSASAENASRTLGMSAQKTFWKITIPLARPSIIAGTALALMEVLGDFGTVDYFAVDTFSTGIFRTWFGLGSKTGAARLAIILLGMIIFLVALEKQARGRMNFYNPGTRFIKKTRTPLGTRGSLFAWLLCITPIFLGMVFPLIRLLQLILDGGYKHFNNSFFGYLVNTFGASFIAAAACTFIAVTMTLLVRPLRQGLSNPAKWIVSLASFGYALPGAVLAVGILFVMSFADNFLSYVSGRFGHSLPLIFSGSFFAVIYAYFVRFSSIPLQGLEAASQKISSNLDGASRTLGVSAFPTLRKLHFPLLKSSILSSLLLVFVDCTKELPATMILRPFNFQTLAIQTYNLASDERLLEASPSAICILLIGILPIFILGKQHAS